MATVKTEEATPPQDLKQPPSTGRKRKYTNSNVKHEKENEDDKENNLNRDVKQDPEQEVDESASSAKKPKSARGRKPGASSAFTKEQDDYIVQLRQQGNNNKEVHRLFEKMFNTGRNEKSIENRYFAIKDSALLGRWEEGLLMQAIEEIENDMTGAIIKRFKELSNGKSVTKGYVMKKMKVRHTTTKE
ncbi:hypothetical protein ABW19_dt0204814 [Dactylella cylindrospora]|nr:hypothetical protein ABW19_dt0204814 [Dactylella cylindrospora]